MWQECNILMMIFNMNFSFLLFGMKLTNVKEKVFGSKSNRVEF